MTEFNLKHRSFGKILYCLFLFLFLVPQIFASRHVKNQFDFSYRAQVAYSADGWMNSDLSRYPNSLSSIIVPVSVQGQALFLFNFLCIGVQAGVTGCINASAYTMPLLAVFGITDVMVIKCGVTFPLNEIAVYDSSIESIINIAAPFSAMLYGGWEIGIITIYYDQLMFNLYMEYLISVVQTAESHEAPVTINIGIRIGKKPRSKSMIGLGLIGIGLHFFD